MKKSYFNNFINIVKYNFNTLIQFEFFYKLILSAILLPLAYLGFDFTMRVTGYSYLTLENIVGFLLNPITILLLFLILLFLAFITMFDISSLIVIFDASYHEKKISTMDVIKISLNKCKSIFQLKNISVIFLVLFLIPFLNVGLTSNVITSIKIPEFIMDFIEANTTLFSIYTIVYLFLLFLLTNWLYSLHYMIIEEKDFKEARSCSKKLIQGNKIKDHIKILGAQLIVFLFYLFFLLLGIVIIVFLHKLFVKLKIIQSILITLIWLFIGFSLIIASMISNGMSYAVISALFYHHKTEKKEKIIPIKYNQKSGSKKANKALKYAVACLMVFSLLGGTYFTYQVITGKANLNIEYVRNMEVTAHRGASVKYPENTMTAFRGAKELGADWIELDVQQTKDKQIVVSHDTNLHRVTGVNKDIIDMTYDEIKELDAGSFFDEKFKGEKIPLLSEVLAFAKENDIPLNIELKPIGREIDFEKQVVDLIKEYHMEDQCVVTSQVYEVLKNTKDYDKDIKTVYVMSIAIGNITDLEYADAFSVEASNVNSSLVSKVHNAGKELFVWTVNTEESINNMIDMNVDNIITDNIELGKELVQKSKSSDLINEFIKQLQ